MTVEILKEGRLPETLVLTATCHNCNAELRWQQGDGKTTEDQREGSFSTINCPCCSHPVHCSLKLAR